NWSFGDYYKKEAIAWHWELVTKVWGIDPKLLWATVYKDDDEAADAWTAMGVLTNPIGRFDHENFWQMGDIGPCGPCSEIHIDRGEKACDGKSHAGMACAVNVEGCERFIELANLVFIQFNRDAAGKLTPLPKKHVDTGTGLERVAAVLQTFERRASGEIAKDAVLGNYDIDLFRAILQKIQEIVQAIGDHISYGENAEADVSYRAIADHARAISFLIADGVVPGNAERQYVLRRLIRRAARHGFKLGVKADFLPDVCASVVEQMSSAYPELSVCKGKIQEIVAEEQGRFGPLLDMGLEQIRLWLFPPTSQELVDPATRTFPAELAFKLHDTYGFPIDLTIDALRDQGIEVDVAGFERLMEEQRERGRAARKEESGAPEIKLGAGVKSRFVGEHRYQAESEVRQVIGDSKDSIAIVTAETPFYAESGGQIGDRGVIETASGAIIEVTDTRKADGSTVHLGKLLRGEIREFEPGARVTLKIDRARRDAAMLNHSATHILHYALREILSKDVRQEGSLVAPDRLRFDFKHAGPVAEGDLQTIEQEINARIRENAGVTVEEMPFKDALAAGALAFFGDKYGDVVRVVRMGDFSVELCGGTHVNRTGDIGLFKFESESGVAAGVRRVEALTGEGALESIRRREKILDEINDRLRATDEASLERLQRLLAREKELEKKIRGLEHKLESGGGSNGAAEESVREVGGIKLVTRVLEGIEPAAMRDMADRMRQKHGSAVIALGSNLGDKAAILVAVTADLTNRIKAGEIVKQIAPIVGGSGGGRPDMAQAGGRDPGKLAQALEQVGKLLES
ncbi:MAG TPA: alanine--tRNA ligase, partial [Candidatus Binataceae bacterium]|nr:alanine--tRNA ligase [Candidatus Binataceae bacterium]